MSEWWRPQRATVGAGDAVLSGWWQPPAAGAVARQGDARAAFAAMLVFLFVLMVAPQETFRTLAAFRPALLAAAVAASLLVIERVFRGAQIAHLPRELKIAGALAAWALVTVPLSLWPGGSLSFFFSVYFKTLATFFLLSQTVTTQARLSAVCWALTLMAVPMALTAIRNYASGKFLDEAYVQRIAGYDSGLAANPNDLALLLNIVLAISLGLLASSRRVVPRIAVSVAAGLLAAGVIVTFSRAGFLTLALILFFCLVRLLRRGRPGHALAVVGLAAGAAVLTPAAYRDRLSTILDIHSDPTGSAQARWADTFAGIRYAAAHPLTGCGVGMNVLALNAERGPTWKVVHNAYVEHAVELGLPGLALFVALLGCCIGTARRVRRAAAASDLQRIEALAWGIQTALAAFALAALFHPVAYQFYFFLPAGLAVALKSVSPPVSVRSTSPIQQHRIPEQVEHATP